MSVSPNSLWQRFVPAQLRDQVNRKTEILHIIQNSSWLIFDKLIRMLLELIVGVWVARYLGPDQYGELAYVLAYIAFFQVVSRLGLDNIVVRNIARNKEIAGQVLSTTFVLRLGAGTLCWLGAVSSMALVNGWQDHSVWLTAIAGGTLVFQAADTIDLWFQSQSQSRRTVIVKIATYLFSNLLKIILVICQAPVLAFAAVIAIDALAAAIGLGIAYWKFPCNQHWNRTISQGLQLLKESWPFMISGLSILIYMRIDQIMIKEILGEDQLGIYAAILPLATLWQFIPMTLTSSIAPFLARKKIENEQAYIQALANIFRLYSALGWLVCIPVALFSLPTVELLFGPAYQVGGQVLVIYVFTNIFINLGLAQNLWLINEGKSKLSIIKTLIGVAISIVGNLFAIPNMGLTGVAIVAVLAQLSSTVLSNLILAPKIFSLQLRSLLLLPHKTETIKAN